MHAPLLRAVRELKSTWGQSLGIALLVAVTTMAVAGGHRARSTLLETRDAWSRDLKLADVEVLYAPTHADVAAPLRGLAGVAAVETRLVVPGRLAAAGAREMPALVRVLPADGLPTLNGLHLVAGRLPHAGEAAVLLDRSLTELHGMGPGARVTLRVEKLAAELPVVGTVASAEHLLYPIHPEYALPLRGALAVVHVSRAAAVAHVEGAATLTDSLLVRFVPGQDPAAATRRVLEAITTPVSAVIPREEQASARVTTMVFSVFDAYLPLIATVLSGVALLLLTLTVARRVRRATLEIGALLAVGHGARQIVAAATLGALLPALAGGLLGALLHGVFARTIVVSHETSLGFGPMRDPGPGVELLVVVAAAVVAAAGTAWLVAWRTAGRRPARLLRAGDAFAGGSVAVRSLAGLSRVLPTSMLLGLSQPFRRPVSAVLATAGLGALLAALLSFLSVQRAYEATTTDAARRSGLDAVVRLKKPAPEAALAELATRSGGRVEPLLTGLALLRGERREGFVQVVGLNATGWAESLLVVTGRGLAAGASGEVVVDRWTADLRGVSVGERVLLFPSLSAPEGLTATVVGIVETLSAGRVYLPLEDARTLFELPGMANGAQVASPLAPADLEAGLRAVASVEHATSYATARREITAMFASGRKVVAISLFVTVLLSMLFLAVVGAMDAQERMPDVAVLHALGWRDRSLRALLLTEVGLRGALGVLAGLIAAPLLAQSLFARLSAANHFTLEPVPDPWMPALLALLCLLALPLAAWPAWRVIHSLAPARALRLLARE